MNYRDEWKKKTAENPKWLSEWLWDHYLRNVFIGASCLIGVPIVLYGSVAALGVSLGACADAYRLRNGADAIYDASNGLGPGVQQICSFLPDVCLILSWPLWLGISLLMLRHRLRSRI